MKKDSFFKLTEEKIKQNTTYSNKRYDDIKKRIQNYEVDSAKTRRVSELKCKSCFYLKGIGAFCAFTDYTCYNCGKKDKHPNSAVPKYCKDCSRKYNACADCGANI